MRMSFVVTMLLLFVCASVMSQQVANESTTRADQEMRAALCDIDRHDYPSAVKRLELLLESNQRNSNARKLWAGLQARMIKPGDKSAENLKLIRKAIDGYRQAVQDLQLTSKEKDEVDSSLALLYGLLGEEELKAELLRRGSDSNRTPAQRATANIVLASKSWNCSYQVTSNKLSPVTAEIERARACVVDGLAYVNQALSLDPESEPGWSYKAYLLKEASTIAGLQHQLTEKTSYQNQYNEALKRQEELSAKARAGREEKSIPQSDDSFTPKQIEQAKRELVEFSAENSLDRLATEFLPIQVELTSLVAPMTPVTKSETSTTLSPTALAQQKHDWKTFAAADDLTLDLPDDVNGKEGDYSAGSEGVIYTLRSVPRVPNQSDLDGVLNTVARTYVGFVSSAWLDKGLGNRFELKLLKKEIVDREPRKLYGYALIACPQTQNGVLAVQASRAHYYTIDIRGADESDPRVQRLLGSVKVK